jgi:uncharacterized protein (DUF433 family)
MEIRITSQPGIFGGKPIVRGLRISVEMVLDLLSQGMTPEEILTEYPLLEKEDIAACLRHAKAVVASEETEIVLTGEGS